MTNLTLEQAKSRLNLNINTDRNGLAGIWCGTPENGYPHGCTADRCYAAFDIFGNLVAYVKYEVLGNKYLYAQKEFGDQLEAAGFGRRGY